ncbi:hypothetical protein [Lewinella sp. JB7]|uniref:hypothetical protein n=1 Tax=Lewinella sp. JB7 TaxID=2962887 RepID=UPI0020C9CF7F|nr:hypothetical protein [Lewinella sp. JB7]MCP9237967.1 hypothetical protein [Lewinella sp. JB7]
MELNSASISAIEDLQRQINDLYTRTFSEYGGGLNLSYPHVPRIPCDYMADRVIIVGQETNTWYNQTEDDLKNIFLSDVNCIEAEGLHQRYDHFIKNHASRYGGKFWQFTRKLYKEDILRLNGGSSSWISHVWINLFAVESCTNKSDTEGRPTKNRELAQAIYELQQDLLAKQIEILHPSIVLFLTGPNNDCILQKSAFVNCEVDFIAVDESKCLNSRMLAEIRIRSSVENAESLPTYIRSYHPTYFMGRINGNKTVRRKLVEKGIECKPSQMYTDKLLEFIKQRISPNTAPTAIKLSI